MAETFNQELFDAMLRHQIGLLRFGGSVRNKVWKLLDASETDLKRQIRRAKRAGFDTPARIVGLEKLLKGVRGTRVTAWKQVRKEWLEEMRSFAVAEPGFYDRAIAAAVPVEIGSVMPAPEVLRNIVSSRPFLGKTLGQHISNIQRADIGRIEDQIKIGLAQQETLPQISRRIVGTAKLKGRDGVTQITRRHAATIARTTTNGIGAEARRAYAELNKDIAPEELFVATLDSSTTPICRRFDGQRFKVGEPPFLPLHMGERSLRVPSLDGEVVGDRPRRDFTEKQLLREFSRKQGLEKVPRKRADLPRGTKGAFDSFARKRMRELTGRTPAKTTYQKWLGRQSAANQDDILGPTRGALFRRGDLTLDKFVEFDGTELTLSQLADRHTDAFLRAGLDPDAFN